MKIIHFGDIHVWRNPLALYDPFYPKRYLGAVNLMLNRRKKFPKYLGQQVLDHILEEDADLVVFSGDLTTASLKSEFKGAAEMFTPLYEKWKERLIIIPGNHDRYTTKATRQDWYGEAFPYAKIDGVRVTELEGNRVVVAFDASCAFMLRSNGMFNSDLENLLEETLAGLTDKEVILVGHYPIDYPDTVAVDPQHELLGRASLKSIVRQYPPVVYLHGHKHIRWRLGNAVNCGSCGMFSEDPLKQAGYAVIKLDGGQITSVDGVHMGAGGEKVLTEGLS